MTPTTPTGAYRTISFRPLTNGDADRTFSSARYFSAFAAQNRNAASAYPISATSASS